MCGLNLYGNVGIGRICKKVDTIQKLEYSTNTIIVDHSCGALHTALLSKKNELITFGANHNYQCSVIQKENNKISNPYFVSKEKELNIEENDFIEKVFAFGNSTMIIVNPFKSTLNQTPTTN